MKEFTGLPAWVWDLLDALDRWEDEHPRMYEMGDADGEYVKTPCGRDYWHPTVPSGAWDALAIRREVTTDE